MIVAYGYAFRRLVYSRTTLVLVIFGICVAFGLAGYLPMTFAYPDVNPATSYALALTAPYVLGMAEILLLLIAIFAAFRANSVYRKELQDGSFLVVLSKPISRMSLLFAKWSAYVSATVVFAVFCSLAHALGVATGSHFTVPAAVLFRGMGFMLGICLVLTFLFSGLAMLLSTFMSAAKMSVSTLGLALLFPISSLISQTMVVPQSQKAPLGGQVNFLLAYEPVSGTERVEQPEEVLARIYADGATTLQRGTPEQRAALFDFMDQLADMGAVNGRLDRNNTTVDSFGELLLRRDELNANYLTSFLRLFLYVPSKEHDPYPSFQAVNFAAQVASLGTYFTDSMYSRYAQSKMAISSDGSVGFDPQRALLDQKFDRTNLVRLLTNQLIFSPSNSSVLAFDPDWVDAYMKDSGGAVYTIRYERYMEPTYVLVAYLLVGMACTVGAFAILRKKNFA